EKIAAVKAKGPSKFWIEGQTIARTIQNIRVIAVGMALLEGTYVEIARNRPLRIDVEFAGEGGRAHFIQCRLRVGEHRAFVLGEQSNRRWTDDAKPGAGARGGEMKFVAGRPIA